MTLEIVKRFLNKFLIACIFCAVASCTSSPDNRDADRLKDVIDPDLGLTREEFNKKLRPAIPEPSAGTELAAKKAKEPSIPDLSEILTSPARPDAVPDKLISLSVTEDVPLKDVLIELSRLADVDMEIDPGITGGIILRVKDKPFKDVVERVVALGGLRYKLENGVMRVERDNPYQVNYKVDYLNMVRTNESTVSIDTKGLGTGDGSTLPSGSTNSITATSEGNIWEFIEKAIQNILIFTETTNSAGGAAASAGNATLDNILQINRPAGVISIIATKRQHKSIAEYLAKVEEQVSAQVLIEAKVVEVTLNDEYRSGIDWGTLTDAGGIGLSVAGGFSGNVPTTDNFFTLSGDSGKNLSTAVSLTETFGVSRTLSSPRLHAMNNQQAVLTFAENSVYFDLDVVEETDDDGTTETTSAKVNSEVKTVPVGVVLSLQPSINLETKEITMHVRPTLSRITTTVSDPGVDIIIARQTTNNPIEVTSEIPVIEVRELDSVLKIKSGDIMVIGGLMQDIVNNEDKGIPFLNRAPLVGNLFKSKVQTKDVVETVIFIKATIVPSSTSIGKGDSDLYKNFMKTDPRPLAF